MSSSKANSKPNARRHTYIVTDINPEHPAVALNNLTVGSKFILPWRGKTHALETEQGGKFTYLCTVAHVGRYEEPATPEAAP